MRLLHIVEHNLMGEAKIIGNAPAVVAVESVGPHQFSHSRVPFNNHLLWGDSWPVNPQFRKGNPKPIEPSFKKIGRVVGTVRCYGLGTKCPEGDFRLTIKESVRTEAINHRKLRVDWA